MANCISYFIRIHDRTVLVSHAIVDHSRCMTFLELCLVHMRIRYHFLADLHITRHHKIRVAIMG